MKQKLNLLQPALCLLILAPVVAGQTDEIRMPFASEKPILEPTP